MSLDTVRDLLPDYAKDLSLNLSTLATACSISSGPNANGCR